MLAAGYSQPWRDSQRVSSKRHLLCRSIFCCRSHFILHFSIPYWHMYAYSHQFNWGLVLNGAAAGGH